MKWILLTPIRIYWFLIPENKRRNCVYCESCSRFVYRTTEENGLREGLKALKMRYRSCRPGYEVIKLEQENTIIIKLSDGSTLQEKMISENIVLQYK